MRHYDGSRKWDRIERSLRNQGYSYVFALTQGGNYPPDFLWTGKETGWELRRLIKDYCEKNGITEYLIIRNESYLRDLHGRRVYELWEKPNAPDTPTK